MNVGYMQVRRLVYRGVIEHKTEFLENGNTLPEMTNMIVGLDINLRKWNNNKKKIKTEKTSRN